MAWWHRRGQKVVCVNDAAWRTGFLQDPVSGFVYTIEGVETEPSDDGLLPLSGIWLLIRGFPESCYCASSFRPVVNKSSETGVAALKRHLVGAPGKEPAE